MEWIVTEHSKIMDKYDPQKRVGLYVDEWGTWYDVEPGTNPGFLYQQNTLRDALVAAVNLNIFHAHADRVRMTNIAQMVNVLQAMILTDKEKMLLTPTYHVFHMYKPFRGATHCRWSSRRRNTSSARPARRRSPPRPRAARDGRLHIALVNLDPRDAITGNIRMSGATPGKLVGHHPHGRRHGRAQHLRQTRDRETRRRSTSRASPKARYGSSYRRNPSSC